MQAPCKQMRASGSVPARVAPCGTPNPRRPAVSVSSHSWNGNGSRASTVFSEPTSQPQPVVLVSREPFTPQQPASKAASHRLPQPKSPVKAARKALIAGNWKLNPTDVKEAKSLAALVASAARTAAADKPDMDVEIVVVPPMPFLSVVAAELQGSCVKLGCQDIYPKEKGAFTGAVSVAMVKSLGVEYVLVGHSERRTIFEETDAEVNAKVKAILAAGLKPILCIGESKAEYEAGMAAAVCARQLSGGLQGVSMEEVSKVVIAYEPVWAIGTGLTATPAIAQAVHAYIRSVLEELYGTEAASGVRVQYGGSVTPESVDDLMGCPDIDGCLVGGASLAADKFSRIFNFSTLNTGVRRLWAQEVMQCQNVLGESPIWSSSRHRLYWINSVGKELWEWDCKGQAHKWTLPEVVGCVALQEGGLLLLPLESGIFSFNPTTGAMTKLCDFEPELGSLTRPNDGRVDRYGNFVIGSYNNTHRQDGLEIGGLYRLSASDGQLREVLGYKHRCSNCIAFTPDGTTAFFCDTPTRRIFAFDYSPTGAMTNRRMLYEMPSHLPGGPDGAQVDNQGYLWVALSGASQVVRIAPDGRVDSVVELPVTQPTSCTFGGPDMDTLFITTRGPDGGHLYSVKLPDGIRGVEEPEFKATTKGLSHSRSGSAISAVGAVNGSSSAAFCDSCGAAYARPSSRYCSECGSPRA